MKVNRQSNGEVWKGTTRKHGGSSLFQTRLMVKTLVVENCGRMTMAMNGCGKISVGAEVLGQRMRAETPDTPKERGGHQGQGHRPRKARTITTISVIPTESQFQKYCGTRGAWRHKRADCYCGKARNTAAVTDTSMSGTPTGNPVTAGTVGVVDRDRRWVTTVAP